MSRVKFNVNTEYAYIQNFKILQSRRNLVRHLIFLQLRDSKCYISTDLVVKLGTFTRHNIERVVPIESLIKCRMQDNLEFLQWTKRHWDQYFPGHDYDALARRKASGTPAAPPPSNSRTSTGTSARKAASTPVNRAAPRVPAGGGVASSALKQENETLKEAIAGLEKERDFYFSKLRDIELLLQKAVEETPEIEQDENGLVQHIQQILYSTEEGFEIPAEGAEVEANGGEELETF